VIEDSRIYVKDAPERYVTLADVAKVAVRTRGSFLPVRSPG
jgi:hypothetical protein